MFLIYIVFMTKKKQREEMHLKRHSYNTNPKFLLHLSKTNHFDEQKGTKRQTTNFIEIFAEASQHWYMIMYMNKAVGKFPSPQG